MWSMLCQSPCSTVAVGAVQHSLGLWSLAPAHLGGRLSRQRPYHGAVSRAFWVGCHDRKGNRPGSGTDPPTPMAMGLTLAVGLCEYYPRLLDF